jgi:hypothetical protein
MCFIASGKFVKRASVDRQTVKSSVKKLSEVQDVAVRVNKITLKVVDATTKPAVKVAVIEKGPTRYK